MWFKKERIGIRKNMRVQVKNYRIFFYHSIPYVIAELQNPEWEGIKELEKQRGKKFEQLRKIYNSTGNWYILEGLDYFWFGWQIFTNRDKNILFCDSMTLSYSGKPDKEKYLMLKNQAKLDIDVIWSKN